MSPRTAFVLSWGQLVGQKYDLIHFSEECRHVSAKGSSAWLTIVVLMLAAPRPAHAYVDPGTGAMLWQVAAASILGCLFYVKRIASWLRSVLGLRSERASGFVFATV